ncbi:MAG TPA: hypothetical protein VMH80_03420 [Bryobacteraceae bacterium]|nr:hypothetical protein [Bryobacteraceae bacterium]
MRIEELYRAAWHESGHAIAAYRCQRPIRRIEVDLEGVGMTRCASVRRQARDHFSGRDWRGLVEQEICICLAGPIAEEITHGRNAQSARVDLQHAHEWLSELMVPDDSVLLTFTARARALLMEPRSWRAVGQVARRLIQGRTISGAGVDAICGALQVPRAR